MKVGRVRERFSNSDNDENPDHKQVTEKVRRLIAHFRLTLKESGGAPLMSGQYIDELSMYAGFNPRAGGREIRVPRDKVCDLSKIENLGEMLDSARRNYIP